jgi:hypothetical protein
MGLENYLSDFGKNLTEIGNQACLFDLARILKKKWNRYDKPGT